MGGNYDPAGCLGNMITTNFISFLSTVQAVQTDYATYLEKRKGEISNGDGETMNK